MFSSSCAHDRGLCTCPNKPVKASAHVWRTPPWHWAKRLLFLWRAPLWVLLVWFADNSHVGEHVVHVCSIYPLIRLQGSALKHASRPSSSPPPTPPVHQIRSPIQALISFHSAQPYLVRGVCKSVVAPTQITPNYCLEIWEAIPLP